MALKLETRQTAAVGWAYGAPVMAVVLTLIAGGLLFAALGFDPFEALYTFFITPLSSAYGLAELGVKAAPLTLCAVGLALGFRANVWNIGAEGQLILGAIFAGGVALAVGDTGSWWVLPLMGLAAMVGGGLWGALPALFKTVFNASEILVSLMLTYVAELLLSLLLHGPWRDPDGYGFPQSPLFGESAVLPLLWDGTRLHVGVLLALAVVALGWLVLARTFVGFQLKVMGLTPVAGGYAGFSAKRIVWMALIFSGALAGLAGMGEVAGPIGQLQPSVSPGYGFTAIIVAFLGRLHPLGILLASLLVALSYLGGEAVQIGLGLPLAVTGVFQGMLLFFLLASDVMIRYRLRWIAPAAPAAKTAEGA